MREKYNPSGTFFCFEICGNKQFDNGDTLIVEARIIQP
jgi:hypothetical protein